VLHVNPTSGNDSTGNGSEGAPFKTLTRALSAAAPNTVILLAPGTYSPQTGETFPILLKPGVTVQGDQNTRGQKIVISGGGTYLSPTVGTQNVAILGADKAGLAGVTVTNSNPRGYGLWVESTSPVVTDSTFTGNTHDGISVNGSGSPVIRNNHFYQNGASGITSFGTSRPEIVNNLFQNTGFGINIGQNGAPVVTGNRLTQNRAGVVVQANGRPVLRNNQIDSNVQDGIVAIASAQPDLGNRTQPGGNIIRNNGQLDINAKATSQTIPAFGNQLSANRTTGRLDLAGNLTAGSGTAALSPATPPTSRPVPIPVLPPPAPTSRPVPVLPPPAPTSPTVASPGAIEIPVPPPSGATPTPAVSVPVQPASRPSALPTLDSPPPPTAVLPVPGTAIPGDSSTPAVTLSQNPSSAAGSPPPPPGGPAAPGTRYRVIVETGSEREQNRVRSLVPQAFRTYLNGQPVMQAGVFSDRNNAEELLEMLQSNGFKATVQELQ
jgi:parallel beta-helix repeat protein